MQRHEMRECRIAFSRRPTRAVLVCFLLGAFAFTPPAEPSQKSDETQAWREDLRVFRAGLECRHADLFHTVSRHDLDAAVEALAVRIPEMERHEIVVEMARLGALVGDGHTSVPILFDPAAGLHTLPIRLGWLRDGIWIEAASRELEPIVGSRVTAVGGVAIEEALERIAPLISRDNDVWIRVIAPLLLTRSEVLETVELGEGPTAAIFTVVRDGVERSTRIEALPSPRPLEHGSGTWREPLTESWTDALAGEQPLYLRYADRAYWWKHLPERDLLYFQFNQTLDDPHGPPVSAVFDEMLRFGDEQNISRLVLDVRHNTGGEGFLNRHLVRELTRWTGRHPNGLFVIIGPRTFSAAQSLVQDLEIWTDAVFVGGPTGSSPRFFGDHSFFHLPNSGLLVSAAPTWWQPGGPYDDRPFLAPHVAAEPTFSDYVAGHDPALEAILSWEDRPRLESAVAPALRGELDAAEAGVRQWAEEPSNRYVNVPRELNELAYRTAREEGWEAALPLFHLNVRVHPDQANPWDSLGEALLTLGRHEEGLSAYRRAWDIDPIVGRAAEVLRRHAILPEEARAATEAVADCPSVRPH